MTTPADSGEGAVAQAYGWASGLIDLARKLIAQGVDVDLAPLRPAIRELCASLKSLPKDETAEWLSRLVELQRELAALGRALAARQSEGNAPQNIPGGPKE